MLSHKNIPLHFLALAAALTLAGCETAEGPAGSAAGDTPSSADAPYNGSAALPSVDDDPQQLMGLDRTALNGQLGKPALVRRDGDAEVWQYRRDRCVLDLFLYGAEKKVEHVDLRNRGDGGADSVRGCFADMLRDALPST